VARGTDDFFDHLLADFMVEDIRNMSDDQLCAEATEDFGKPNALAAEFDAIVSPILSHDDDDQSDVDVPGSPREVAQYIHEVTAELIKMARLTNFNSLAYRLKVASHEAKKLAQTASPYAQAAQEKASPYAAQEEDIPAGPPVPKQ
jgi:hypothetical protein